jgi:precorrin-6B methylase 2
MSCDESLLYAESRNTSWIHHDKHVLQSAGDFSRGFARALTRMFIPQLDGLQARMSADDAAFLDVGVGVAALSCELATLWPKLRITGLDVWAPSLALARANIAGAGLGARVTVREQAAEALEDTATYDLAWLPVIFMPEKVIPTAIERTLRALKPGGWLVTGLANIEGSDPMAAFWRLRTTMFGGPTWTLDHLKTLLANKGFVDVRILPTPPGAPALVAGRRG